MAPELVTHYLLTVRRELDGAVDCLSLTRRESAAVAAGDGERCAVLAADSVVRGTVAACRATRAALRAAAAANGLPYDVVVSSSDAIIDHPDFAWDDDAVMVLNDALIDFDTIDDWATGPPRRPCAERFITTDAARILAAAVLAASSAAEVACRAVTHHCGHTDMIADIAATRAEIDTAALTAKLATAPAAAL